MSFIGRRNRLALVALSISGVASVAGALAACGGEDNATTIANPDGDGGSDANNTQKPDGAATDGGGSSDGSSGKDGAIMDAGRDAQRVTNPDGGCDPVQNGER